MVLLNNYTFVQFTVQISKSKELLIVESQPKNRQECYLLYGLSLGEMRYFLDFMNEFSLQSRQQVRRTGGLHCVHCSRNLISVYCQMDRWLFSAAVQQYLNTRTGARVVNGIPLYPEGESRIRTLRKIQELYSTSRHSSVCTDTDNSYLFSSRYLKGCRILLRRSTDWCRQSNWRTSRSSIGIEDHAKCVLPILKSNCLLRE